MRSHDPPAAQTPRSGVSHNANVPAASCGRDVAVAEAHDQGGNSVVDFTDLDNVREIAWSDLANATGLADSWVDVSGYNRPRSMRTAGSTVAERPGNRGVDAFHA